MSPTATPLRAFRFERLLVGDRWARDVRVEVDAAGWIASLEPGSAQDGCETVTGWAVPGVPNVHSHSFQRALAGLAEGRGPDSFWSWREVMYAFLGRLTPDAVEAITAQLYIEMLKAGFTCVGEFHYLHHPPDGGRYDDPAVMSRRILAAARTAGIGLVHMPVVYETGGFGGEPLEGGQRRFRLDLEGAARMHEALAGDFSAAGARLGWALHSLRAVSAESFGRIGGFAGGATPVHIHVAEQEGEVRECLARRGARPVEWLLGHAPVDERWCLVHATHVNRKEVAAVAGCGAVAGLCPTTEANLGDGLFPLGAFAGAGGRFAIGTDSHVSRSPVEELRLLEYGQRLVLKSRSGLGGGGGVGSERGDRKGGPEGDAAGRGGARGGGVLAGAGGALLAHAWEGGCRALGWEGGGLECGKRADVVVLDAEHSALVGREGAAVLDSWVFSGTDNPVRDVMVGGEWVVRDGRHLREEVVTEVFAEAVGGMGGGDSGVFQRPGSVWNRVWRKMTRMAKQLTLAAALSLLAASSGGAAPFLQAQETVRVSSDVVCGECVITIDTVLTLGGLYGEGMEVIDITSAIAVDARERILITNIFHPRIYVFDMAGRFLRTVGRHGEGPGEYSRISHINAGSRYIHVFEFHSGRTLLDHDFEFVRRDRFPRPNRSVVRDGLGGCRFLHLDPHSGCGRAQASPPRPIRRFGILRRRRLSVPEADIFRGRCSRRRDVAVEHRVGVDPRDPLESSAEAHPRPDLGPRGG